MTRLNGKSENRTSVVSHDRPPADDTFARSNTPDKRPSMYASGLYEGDWTDFCAPSMSPVVSPTCWPPFYPQGPRWYVDNDVNGYLYGRPSPSPVDIHKATYMQTTVLRPVSEIQKLVAQWMDQPTPSTQPAVEVLIGHELNIFHVGAVTSVELPSEAHQLAWLTVVFEHWGTYRVPSGRVRLTNYPHACGTGAVPDCHMNVGGRCEVYKPATPGEAGVTTAHPAAWITGDVVEIVCGDPREALELNFPVPNAPYPGENSCAYTWGGDCSCNKSSIKQTDGQTCTGTASIALAYIVSVDDQRLTVPWYAMRHINPNSGIDSADITSATIPLPEVLYKQVRAADESDDGVIDDLWIDGKGPEKIIGELLHSWKVLTAEIVKIDAEPHIKIIGRSLEVHNSQKFLQSELSTLRTHAEFTDRRERRLKSLKERKSKYEKTDQLEFEADDSLVGLIIGKQGEKLIKVAKSRRVEVRVLPDDNGYRRIRIYGGTPANAIHAKNELAFALKYLRISPKTASFFNEKKMSLFKDLLNKYNLASIWLDDGKSSEPIGIRESVVVVAYQQALSHPTKKLAITKGTIGEPVIVICGNVPSLEAATTAVEQINANASRH